MLQQLGLVGRARERSASALCTSRTLLPARRVRRCELGEHLTRQLVQGGAHPSRRGISGESRLALERLEKPKRRGQLTGIPQLARAGEDDAGHVPGHAPAPLVERGRVGRGRHGAPRRLDLWLGVAGAQPRRHADEEREEERRCKHTEPRPSTTPLLGTLFGRRSAHGGRGVLASRGVLANRGVLARRANSYCQAGLAEGEDVAIRQRPGLDRLTVDERRIGTAEILDPPLAVDPEDSRVAPRCLTVGEREIRRGIAAHHQRPTVLAQGGELVSRRVDEHEIRWHRGIRRGHAASILEGMTRSGVPTPTPAPTPVAACTPAAAALWMAAFVCLFGGCGGGNDGPPLPAAALPARVGETPHPQELRSPADLERAIAILERVVRQHGGDETLPWGIAHGVLALGPDFETTTGKNGVQFLYAEVAQELEHQGEKLALPSFPNHRFCEPHVDLMLKCVLEAGVPLDTEVAGHWGQGTIRNHIAASLVRRKEPPANASRDVIDDLPWTLQALCTVFTPGSSSKAFPDLGRSLDQLTDRVALELERADATLAARRQAGQPLVKDGQGIQGFTCGGAHLYQGVLHAVGRGFGSPDARARIEASTDLLFWRLRAEIAAYDEAASNLPPGLTQLDLDAQRLKFLGHWNESIHKAMIVEVFTPSARQRAQLRLGLELLVRHVERLDAEGTYERIPELRKSGSPRALDNYFNLIGDSAHALRGLRLATGKDGLRW